MGLGQAEPLAACPGDRSTLPTLAEVTGDAADRGDHWPTWSKATPRAAGGPTPRFWTLWPRSSHPPGSRSGHGGHQATSIPPGCGMPPNCSRSESSSSPCPAETCRAWPMCRPALASSSPMDLRFDVGQKLRHALEAKVGKVQVQSSIRRPAVGHADRQAGRFSRRRQSRAPIAGEEFRPCVAADGKDLTTDRFRKLLEDDGFQVWRRPTRAIRPAGPGPSSATWTRPATRKAVGLAHRIPELIAQPGATALKSLLAAGWQEVRIVTDHGWLLMPGGLPKADLPKYLTATRWRRCAVVKESATVDCLLRVVLGRGCADRLPAGNRLLHGRRRIQPRRAELAGMRGPAACRFGLERSQRLSAKIEHVKWAGLRCQIKVTGQFDGCKVDLRDKAADPILRATARSVRGGRSRWERWQCVAGGR